MGQQSIPAARLWIHGEETDALDGSVFDTDNPASGTQLTTLARGSRGDVDRAVQSAREGFGVWRKLSGERRAQILWRVGELIDQRGPELARLEAVDTGKPVTNATKVDVPRSADTFRYFSGWATKLHGQTIPVRGPYLNYTLREPLGVVGAITPWNFPLLLAARKIAAALAAGNTVVLKPPEEASLTSIELGRILSEAGAPPGTLNVVTGIGEEAGAALVEHPGVDKISFTGGTETGKHIVRSAAATLKKVTLELGGKSPNIILADADLASAIPAAARAVFYNQGEICTAGSRLLVEQSVLDQVSDGVVQHARQLRLGDPLEPSTELGPLVSRPQLERVLGYIDGGVSQGARKRCGGRLERSGYFVEPTIFDRVESEMTIARDEIFGPVLAVMSFRDLDELVRLANATEYGLAAGIWTRDIGRAHALAAALQAGTVWINGYNLFHEASPYGGYKQSGFGRENGEEVMREMTQTKSVWVTLDS